MKIDKVTKIINLAMIIIVFIFLFFLVWYDINPKGQRKVIHTFDKTNSLIRGPYPDDRLNNQKQVGKNYWEIAIDPVYFDLYIPRLYQRISFSTIFQLANNTNNDTVIELGGLGSDQGWQVTLKPIYNYNLENLKLDCKKFPYSPANDISVCAGRESLPVELNNWSEILEKYPTAEYATYNFSSSRLADLNIKKWEQNFTKEDFDFLLTTYQPVVDLGNNWKKGTAVFSPDELWLAGHIYKFIISAPDLTKNNQTIYLKSVEFYLEKEPITRQNFKDKLLRFWERFKLRF